MDTNEAGRQSGRLTAVDMSHQQRAVQDPNRDKYRRTDNCGANETKRLVYSYQVQRCHVNGQNGRKVNNTN